MGKYDSIIKLPHHISKVHPQMSLHDRAAQFAPFAALTGYDDMVKETARVVDSKIELSEGLIAELNENLNYIKLHLAEHISVKITYFIHDDKKQGGKYYVFVGVVKKIDEYNKTIIFTNGLTIPIDDIYCIDCQFSNED